MAKGNPFIGKTSGSVGDIVTYGRGKDQIVRRRAREVKNPRTAAQTLNRVIASTIGQAYSRMNAIVDHSFQGYSTKAENMQRFFKANQQAIRKRLANSADPLNEGSFQAVGQKGLVRFPFVLSEGSLPALTCRIDYAAQTGAEFTLYLNFNGEGVPTYQDICDGLGLQRGDQITLVCVKANLSSSPADVNEYWGVSTAFKYARIILDPIDPNSDETSMSVPFINEGGLVNCPNPRNETTALSSLSMVDDRLKFVFNSIPAVGMDDMGVAAIASRKEGGVWLRSNAVLQVVPLYSTTPTLAQAINASYPDTTGLTDPTKFLNAAMQGLVG